MATGVIVHAHWPLEISNSRLVAVRRKRIPDQRPGSFLNELSILPIVPEPPLTSTQSESVFTLAKKHNLASYDAAYLELAVRLDLPLATLDTDLRKAAQAENLKLL